MPEQEFEKLPRGLYRCTRCETRMQKRSVINHSRKWCRATWAVRRRLKSGLAKLYMNRVHIADSAGIRKLKGISSVGGGHTEFLGIDWCWWTDRWVVDVLDITGQKWISAELRQIGRAHV